MKRNLTKLAQQQYDVIIVGGGIYGAWAAWDAGLRGFSVALLERADFGGATSANSMKVIHGGLRYLQHLDLKRMRESIRERSTLLRVAPHLVNLLPCLMPTYGHGLKGREVMSVALRLNDLISFDRNRGIDPQKQIPRGKILSRAELRSVLPGVPEQNLTGGAQWYDCQLYNSERLTFALLTGAAEKGAQLANYAEVTDFITDDHRVIGVKVKDGEDGVTHRVFGKVVLNTSGPWINRTLAMLNGFQPMAKTALAKGINLIVNRQLFPHFGVGVPSTYSFKDRDAVFNKGARLLFVTPWRKYSILGTSYFPYERDPSEQTISKTDIHTLLDEFNQAYPALRVRRDEICAYHLGILPASEDGSEQSENINAEKQYKLIDHQQTARLEGLISVLGVKYTTARDVASRAVDLVAKKLGRSKAKCVTAIQPIAGGDRPDVDAYFEQQIAKRPWGLTDASVRHLILHYGTRYTDILQHLTEDQKWGKRICEREDVLAAEVLHGVRHEMARTLSDAVRRRTELGSAMCPDDASLQKCAEILAGELGWDSQKIDDEIALTKAGYQPEK